MASAHNQYGGEIIFWFLIKLLFFEVSEILLDKSTEAVRQAKMMLGVAACCANLPSKGRWWLVVVCRVASSLVEPIPRCPVFLPIKNIPPHAHSMEEDSFLGSYKVTDLMVGRILL